MQRTIQLAQRIIKNPDKSWLNELQEINLHNLFAPVFQIEELTPSQMNSLVAYIILAYDNDSSWINLRQDRYENKLRILKGIGVNQIDFFILVTHNDNDLVNSIISEYIIEQCDWRWQTIFSLLDYHAKMIRFANQKTETERRWEESDKEEGKVSLFEEYDATTITKINKEKGDLLAKAIDAREKADKLLAEIKKEFVSLDHAVQQDFTFSITDEKKIDPMSWSQFIRKRNERKKVTSQ